MLATEDVGVAADHGLVDALLRDLGEHDRGARQDWPRRGHGTYLAGPGPWNAARAERERSTRAMGLVRAYDSLEPSGDRLEVPTRLGHHFGDLLEREVARARVAKHHRPRVVEAAQGFVHRLREHGLHDPCDEVLARAGVDLAVNHELRLDLRVALDQEDPTRWWWSTPARWGRQMRNGPYNFQSPIFGENVQWLRRQPSVFERGLPDRLLVEPKWPWDHLPDRLRLSVLADPLRLPLLGVRWAAEAIVRVLGRLPAHVLTIECGKAITSQALSAWLPTSIIHAVPSVGLIGHQDPRVRGKSPAVILGLPRVGAVHYLYMMTSYEAALTEAGHEDLLRHAASFRDERATVAVIVNTANHVRSGGVLVAFADFLENEVAVRVLRDLRFVPIDFGSGVDTAKTPIWATWSDNSPERPLQVLGPTDRLISVWRAP